MVWHKILGIQIESRRVYETIKHLLRGEHLVLRALIILNEGAAMGVRNGAIGLAWLSLILELIVVKA